MFFPGHRTCCMKTVFVFGSNFAGRHGKGAALHARKHHGAVYGQGVGSKVPAMLSPRRMPTCALCRWTKSSGTSLILRPSRSPDRISHSRLLLWVVGWLDTHPPI